jgi:hypothetical protein
MKKQKRPKLGRPPLNGKAMTVAERQHRYRERLKAQREALMTQTETNGGELQKVPPALPETRTDLLAHYKLKRKRSINDLVEDIVVKLWEDEEFQKLVDAIYDSDSVHGSMADDDVMAALMIKEVAKKNGPEEVAEKNIHTIKLAMRVVLRRFTQGRSERFEKAELPAPATHAAPAAE